ncbi:hypothetical protein SDJN02_17489, partial [Cucurbita argyrosperma subsp. argyrosperma]
MGSPVSLHIVGPPYLSSEHTLGRYLGRTPVRTSNRHDSAMQSITIVVLPLDGRNQVQEGRNGAKQVGNRFPEPNKLLELRSRRRADQVARAEGVSRCRRATWHNQRATRVQRSRVEARVVGLSARAVGRVGFWTRVVVAVGWAGLYRWAAFCFDGPRVYSLRRAGFGSRVRGRVELRLLHSISSEFFGDALSLSSITAFRRPFFLLLPLFLSLLLPLISLMESSKSTPGVCKSLWDYFRCVSWRWLKVRFGFRGGPGVGRSLWVVCERKLQRLSEFSVLPANASKEGNNSNLRFYPSEQSRLSLSQTLKKEGVELLGREINPPPLFPAEEEGPEII